MVAGVLSGINPVSAARAAPPAKAVAADASKPMVIGTLSGGPVIKLAQ
jgi:hypothetical protein